MNILKSIGAVLAGAVVGVVLSIVTDEALRAAGIFTPLGHPMSDALLLLATFYRTVYGILGSYVTARLAPNRPMMHALILGAIGVAASLAGVVVAWNRVAEFGPALVSRRVGCVGDAAIVAGRPASRDAIGGPPSRFAPRRNFVTRCLRWVFIQSSLQKNRSRLVTQHVIHNAVRKYRCSAVITS